MEVIDILRRLVAFDTTSRRSNLDLVGWVAGLLEEHGARIRLTYGEAGRKANLLAGFGPDVPGGVLLSGHTDVVPVEGQDWSSDPFTLAERDGRLHGRGTADMKGFIAACLAAAAGWRHAPLARPIHLALTHDEETGALGVPSLIADLIGNVPLPAVAIVGEPTGMLVADRHPGYLAFRSMFQGRAAHSSDPSAGVSAVAAAARFAAWADDMRTPGGGEGERATLNVGRIDGGTNINMVPASCEVLWELRPEPTADLTALRTTVRGLVDAACRPGLTVETQEIVTVPPLRPQEPSPAVRLARRLGAERRTIGVPYGSEAGFFQAAGISTVVCGPGSIDQAHRADEWIAAEQLDGATRFLTELTSWAVHR